MNYPQKKAIAKQLSPKINWSNNSQYQVGDRSFFQSIIPQIFIRNLMTKNQKNANIKSYLIFLKKLPKSKLIRYP